MATHRDNIDAALEKIADRREDLRSAYGDLNMIVSELWPGSDFDATDWEGTADELAELHNVDIDDQEE